MSLAQNIEIDFKNALKKKQAALNDEEVMAVLRRELKKRQDSILAFSSAGRNDLADQEKAEAEIINAYLPALMAETDVARIVDAVIASGVNGFGLVMKEVMAQTKGQADGQLVQKLVKAKLAL